MRSLWRDQYIRKTDNTEIAIANAHQEEEKEVYRLLQERLSAVQEVAREM